MGYALATSNGKDSDEDTVFNHLTFIVRYHEPSLQVPERISEFRSRASQPKPGYRIVGFEVQPESRSDGCSSANESVPFELS